MFAGFCPDVLALGLALLHGAAEPVAPDVHQERFPLALAGHNEASTFCPTLTNLLVVCSFQSMCTLGPRLYDPGTHHHVLTWLPWNELLQQVNKQVENIETVASVPPRACPSRSLQCKPQSVFLRSCMHWAQGRSI